MRRPHGPEVALLACAMAIGGCRGAHPGFEPKVEASQNRIAQIAGEYYFGDGLQENCRLTIDAIGHFTYRWRGALGVEKTNEGLAHFDGSILRLLPERANDPRSVGGTATRFVPVTWGDRRYLVRQDQMPKFFGDVDRHTEPRYIAQGSYYLRRDDWHRRVSGRPSVPAEYLKY